MQKTPKVPIIRTLLAGLHHRFLRGITGFAIAIAIATATATATATAMIAPSSMTPRILDLN